MKETFKNAANLGGETLGSLGSLLSMGLMERESRKPRFRVMSTGVIKTRCSGAGHGVGFHKLIRVEIVPRTKYTGSELRELRAKRGVGRPPQKKEK